MLRVAAPDGTPIAVHDTGDPTAPPILLIHGSLGDHRRFAPLVPHLAPHFCVYAMDRRGRGGSGDAADHSLDREVDDVVAVVAALAERHGTPVAAFGHSFGALVLLEAARHTRHLARMVLYEPVVDAAGGAFATEAERLLRDDRRDEVVELFLRSVVGLPAKTVETMKRDGAWSDRLSLAHTLPREDRVETAYRFDPATFADVGVPTLMLLGSDTPAPFPDSTARVAAALPDVQVARLDGQAHLAIQTAPAAVAAYLVPFLRGDGD